MDGRRFDSLTAAFARRRTRRSALRGAGLAALFGGVAGFRGTTAQEATPAAHPDGSGSAPILLFVQTATGGGFSPNPHVGTPAVEGTPTVGGGAAYLLTLEGHHGATIYFADRPDRIFGDWPTQQFLDTLGFTPDNPPNAALVIETDEDAEDEVIILELIEPTFDESAGTLTYGATVIGAYAGKPLTAIVADQSVELVPERFGRASLFIDDLQQQSDCQVTGCVVPNVQGTGISGGFDIPGGPYDGYYRNVDDVVFGYCTPMPGSEYQLNEICNEDPRCERLGGGAPCYPN